MDCVQIVDWFCDYGVLLLLWRILFLDIGFEV